MKRAIAALIGVVAGALLLGGYIFARQAGIHIPPEIVAAAAGALAFAGTVAVFALLTLDRSSDSKGRMPLLLNDEPATRLIFYFKGDHILPIQARPDQSAGEVLVRYSDTFKTPPGELDKDFVLSLKGSRRGTFNPTMLQQIFGTLKPFKLAHVLLMNDEEFVGYIPGKRALKEFTGDEAPNKIEKYVLQVLAKPAESTRLRELGGVTCDEVISETDNSRNAEAKIWANDSTQGLVIHNRLKPIGFISRVDVFRLNAARP